MGRPIKKRVREGRIRYKLEHFIDCPNFLPQDSIILQRAMTTLLNNVYELDPKRGMRCSAFLKMIAVSEEMGDRDEDWIKQLSDCLDAPEDRHDHLPMAFDLQHEWLRRYLTNNSYPPKPTTFRSCTEWFDTHKSKISNSLRAVPCLCYYSLDFDSIDFKKFPKCYSRSELLHLILAALHGTTPAAIQKQMSPSYMRKYLGSS